MRTRGACRRFFTAFKAGEIVNRTTPVAVTVPRVLLFFYKVIKLNGLQYFFAIIAKQLPLTIRLRVNVLLGIQLRIAFGDRICNAKPRMRTIRAAAHREGNDIGAEAFRERTQGCQLLIRKASQRILFVALGGLGVFFQFLGGCSLRFFLLLGLRLTARRVFGRASRFCRRLGSGRFRFFSGGRFGRLGSRRFRCFGGRFGRLGCGCFGRFGCGRLDRFLGLCRGYIHDYRHAGFLGECSHGQRAQQHRQHQKCRQEFPQLLFHGLPPLSSFA